MCNQFIVSSTPAKLIPRPITPTEEPAKKQRDSPEHVVLRQVLADMKRHRQSGDSQKMAETWNALGLIRLHMQRDASSARECHEEALRILQQDDCNNKRLIAITLHDLGYCCERMEERTNALSLYKEAISLLQQDDCDKSHPRMIATQRAMNRVLRS